MGYPSKVGMPVLQLHTPQSMRQIDAVDSSSLGANMQ